MLLVKIFFSWGHMVRPPFVSGGGGSLPYPPPTTLIGALTAPYMKLNKPIELTVNGREPYSPSIELLGKAVYYAVLGYKDAYASQVIDLSKQFIYAYLRKEHKKNKRFWSAAIGFGKTYSPGEAYIAYIVSRDKAYEFSKIAWGITRIGSKEGLVSVKNVVLLEKPEILTSYSVVNTIFPTPKNIAECIEDCSETYFWKLNKDSYTAFYPKKPGELLEPYLVPTVPGKIYGGDMVVKPDPVKSVVYKIELEDLNTHLIVSKEVVEGIE